MGAGVGDDCISRCRYVAYAALDVNIYMYTLHAGVLPLLSLFIFTI